LSAQTDASYQSRRAQAFAFYDSNKFVDALPLLERLHAEKPEDVAVLARLSFATLAHSATLPDASEQEQERVRARKLADEAKAAGDDSNLIKIVLAVPEDGGEMSFAGTAEVQAAKSQKMMLARPRIVPPNQIEGKGKNQTNITIDPSTLLGGAKKDGTKDSSSPTS
jgi:hypothetical protein